MTYIGGRIANVERIVRQAPLEHVRTCAYPAVDPAVFPVSSETTAPV